MAHNPKDKHDKTLAPGDSVIIRAKVSDVSRVGTKVFLETVENREGVPKLPSLLELDGRQVEKC